MWLLSQHYIEKEVEGSMLNPCLPFLSGQNSHEELYPELAMYVGPRGTLSTLDAAIAGLAPWI